MNDLPPPGIVTARINPETGLLAAPGDPDAVMEMFMEEFAPTETATPDQRLDDPYAPAAAEQEEPIF